MQKMTFDDEELRRIYQRYVYGEKLRADPSCPGIAQIDKIFDPRCRPGAKFKLIDHLTRCPSCARDFDFLLGLHRFESHMIPTSLRERQPLRFRSLFDGAQFRLRFSSLICGLILVLVSMGIVISHWVREDSIRAGRPVIRILEHDQQFTDSAPVELRWDPVRRADYYILELFDGELMPLWTSEWIRTSSLVLPKEVRGRMASGRPYFWTVEAYDAAGQIASSDMARFVLRGK